MADHRMNPNPRPKGIHMARMIKIRTTTKTVEVIDHAWFEKILKKGPVDIDCTREQANALKTNYYGRHKVVPSMRQLKKGLAVVGYRFELQTKTEVK